jgi:hypothetical protein
VLIREIRGERKRARVRESERAGENAVLLCKVTDKKFPVDLLKCNLQNAIYIL